jgi:hypothetical protein
MMEPSFEKLLALLAEAGVAFVLVGGVAVTIQGYVRLTEDVDVLVDDDPENLRRLLTTLSGYGEGFASELSIADFTEEEGAIRIVEESEQCQIDVFTRMTGRRYHDVLEDADSFLVKGHSIPVASKAALIGWKEASTREKDRLDALALKRLLDKPDSFH